MSRLQRWEYYSVADGFFRHMYGTWVKAEEYLTVEKERDKAISDAKTWADRHASLELIAVDRSRDLRAAITENTALKKKLEKFHEGNILEEIIQMKQDFRTSVGHSPTHLFMTDDHIEMVREAIGYQTRINNQKNRLAYEKLKAMPPVHDEDLHIGPRDLIAGLEIVIIESGPMRVE